MYSKEISDLQSETAEKKLEYFLKIKEVLMPNQFKKLLHLELEGVSHDCKEWEN